MWARGVVLGFMENIHGSRAFETSMFFIPGMSQGSRKQQLGWHPTIAPRDP